MSWVSIPSSPPVAGTTTGHATDHQSIYNAIRELRTEHARGSMTLAVFYWDGTTATARLNDGTGTIIASGSDPATILNAAVSSASGAGGGTILVYSNQASIPITAPIVLTDNVSLIGSGAVYNDQAPHVQGDAVLKASGSGMTTSNAIIQSTGNSAGPCLGLQVIGLGLDGNNQTMCWHTLNANAPVIKDCIIVHGEPYCVWFESDIAPNPLPGGGFAATVVDCTLHGVSAGGGGNAVIKSSGTGATDGHVQQCIMHTSTTPIGCDLSGGWEITGNHLTGTTTTTSLLTMNGANSVAVGNYFDTAKAGNNIIINQPKCVVNGNYILNGGATSQSNACIQINASKGVVTGNFLDTTGNGYGMRHSGTGAPSGGVYAMNHSNGVKGFIDNGGAVVPDTNNASTYVAGNTVFQGS